MAELTPFEALIPEAFVVLGIRLQPFTLGHAALLIRLGSGAWLEGGKIGIDDLYLGVTVCSSNSFEQFRRDIFSGHHQDRITSIAAQVKIGNVKKEAKLFTRYICEGMQGPKVLIEDSNRIELKSHVIQSLRVQMMRFFRVPERDVMDIPIAAAMWDLATLSELNQTGRIWGKEEENLKKQAEEFDRNFRKKNGIPPMEVPRG